MPQWCYNDYTAWPLKRCSLLWIDCDRVTCICLFVFCTRWEEACICLLRLFVYYSCMQSVLFLCFGGWYFTGKLLEYSFELINCITVKNSSHPCPSLSPYLLNKCMHAYCAQTRPCCYVWQCPPLVVVTACHFRKKDSSL